MRQLELSSPLRRSPCFLLFSHIFPIQLLGQLMVREQ